MESNNRNDMPAFMDTDLDPYTLVHDIVSNWWVIILGNCGSVVNLCSCKQQVCSGVYNAGDICGGIQRRCECVQ